MDIRCAQPALLALEMASGNMSNYPPNCTKTRSTYNILPVVTPALPFLPLPALPAGLPRCPGYSDLLLSGGDSFGSLVLSGRLYEHLMELTGLGRDAVKLAVLRNVLAKRGRYRSVVEQVFRESFPGVYRFVRQVNRDDHAALSGCCNGGKAGSWLRPLPLASRAACPWSRCMTRSTARGLACRLWSKHSVTSSIRLVFGCP